jgi:hypothetical protein
MADIVNTFLGISKLPTGDEEFCEWLKFQDVQQFLLANRTSEDFVLYGSLEYAFVYGIAVPAASVNPPDIEDLIQWDCNPTGGWGVAVQPTQPPRVWVEPPLHGSRSITLKGGEQLLFHRDFEGRIGPKKSYVELLQKLTQILGIHYLPECKAYCRLDEHGDIEEIVRVIEVAERGEHYGGTIISCNRKALDHYLALTDAAIVQMFDFTRFRPSHFRGWKGDRERHVLDPDLFCNWHIEPGYAGYMRGCQVVRPQISKEQAAMADWPFGLDKEKQHASFIAFDWKHDVVQEISCSPDSLANYFTESDLPFETTPAFFKPGVLSKYKADADKYTIAQRSITCRGAWHLQTYDINDAGQVHTYLVYLQHLPYAEQLYWKSYNERPKGTLSKRAIKTDFEGEWDLQYDALDSLKDCLGTLNRNQVPWWTIRNKGLLERVQYPATTAAEEWANELLLLDQLVVEGFETKWLRKKAQEMARPIQEPMASLRLAEECLTGLGIGDAEQVLRPLKTLHGLRSKLKGHASGDEALAITKRTLEEARTFREHYKSLCQECDESMRTIARAFEEKSNK